MLDPRYYAVGHELDVFGLGVLDKLILSIVAYTTSVTVVWLLISVAAFVIISISNCSEALDTVLTLIRFFTSVDSDMH